MNVIISISLDDKEDRDLLAWLSRLPRGQKSAEIRRILRTGLNGADDFRQDIRDIKRDIKRLLESGAVVASGDGKVTAEDEPPDVAAALDRLGL